MTIEHMANEIAISCSWLIAFRKKKCWYSLCVCLCEWKICATRSDGGPDEDQECDCCWSVWTISARSRLNVISPCVTPAHHPERKCQQNFMLITSFLWHPGWCEALWVHSYWKNNGEFHFSYGSSEVWSDAWLHLSHCAAVLVKNLIPTIPSYHIFQIFLSTSGSLQHATVGWNVITLHSYKKVNRMCQQVSQLYQTRTSRGAYCNDRTTGASVYVKKSTALRVTRLG